MKKTLRYEMQAVDGGGQMRMRSDGGWVRHTDYKRLTRAIQFAIDADTMCQKLYQQRAIPQTVRDELEAALRGEDTL